MIVFIGYFCCVFSDKNVFVGAISFSSFLSKDYIKWIKIIELKSKL